MTAQHSQELMLRGIANTAEAYKFLIYLPTVEFANLMDLSLIELASLQGSKHNCGLCQAPDGSSAITMIGMRLPCNHTFCVECTFNWFHPRKFRNACPSCHAEIFRILYVDEDEDEDEDEDSDESPGADGVEEEGAEGEDDESSDTHPDKDDMEEDDRTTDRGERTISGCDNLAVLGAKFCGDAATTTARESPQLARSRKFNGRHPISGRYSSFEA